jgi:hypothetical protein
MQDNSPAGIKTEELMRDVRRVMLFPDVAHYNKAWGIINAKVREGVEFDNYDAVIILLGSGYKFKPGLEEQIKKDGKNMEAARFQLAQVQAARLRLEAKMRRSGWRPKPIPGGGRRPF